jgi:hypothetical protein
MLFNNPNSDVFEEAGENVTHWEKQGMADTYQHV